MSSTNGRRGWWPTGLRGDEAGERKGYSTRALEEAAYPGAGPQQASLTRRTAKARLHTGRCPRVQWRPQRPGSPPGRRKRKRKRVWRVSGSTREQEGEDPGARGRELQRRAVWEVTGLLSRQRGAGHVASRNSLGPGGVSLLVSKKCQKALQASRGVRGDGRRGQGEGAHGVWNRERSLG